MRRPRAHWREDHLGSAVRLGLAGVRGATPSPAVWDRIADAIEPPPQDGPVKRTLLRLSRAAPGGGRGALGMPWLLLPGSAALAVMLMFAVVREAPPTQLGAARGFGGPLVGAPATLPTVPSMVSGSPAVLAGSTDGNRVALQVVMVGDAAGQVEAPDRWSRFEPGQFDSATDRRGPVHWLAAPEIALIY